jgi:uncharacterized protein DUF3891
MLLRSDGDDVLAIGQASHAWISGQLARAWGNERFGELEPREPVCLAAEQHDVGMAAWDLRPTWNPDSGLPHAFTEMPVATHLELWRAGPARLVTQSPYAAVLVSRHGQRLNERRDLARLNSADAAAVRRFIADAQAFQDDLVRRARADPAQVARNSDLVWTWDFLSLALCLDWPPTTAHSVPTADGTADIVLAAAPDAITLDPWPFAAPRVEVRAEGRRLARRYETEAEMTEALMAADWETFAFVLRPAEH